MSVPSIGSSSGNCFIREGSYRHQGHLAKQEGPQSVQRNEYRDGIVEIDKIQGLAHTDDAKIFQKTKRERAIRIMDLENGYLMPTGSNCGILLKHRFLTIHVQIPLQI